MAGDVAEEKMYLDKKSKTWVCQLCGATDPAHRPGGDFCIRECERSRVALSTMREYAIQVISEILIVPTRERELAITKIRQYGQEAPQKEGA